MRNVSICLALVVVCSGYASASLIGVDYVVVYNGQTPVFYDGFNGSVLDMPPWVILSGSPGPVSGSVLTMKDGDDILTGLVIDPNLDITVVAHLNITSITPGAIAGIYLFGLIPGENLVMGITPTAALIGDQTNLLGGIPFQPGASVDLSIVAAPNGSIQAYVNNTAVYVGPSDFHPASGFGVFVVPEPVTVGLLGVASLVGLGVRSRRRRSVCNMPTQ